ncbi:MAG: alpha/beta fold hydrolase [Minicystis sp.]
MQLAPTPKDTLFRDGTAALYRFRRPDDAPAAGAGLPLLLVPSMINRWYVLDLRPGASMADALVRAGIDTFCLDWGTPQDEDRYLSWDDVIARLGRMVRAVRRETGAPKVGILGYCMGATLSSVYTALEPDSVAALANLAGPVDFSKAGFLGDMVDARYFDAAAIGAAGNMSPEMMQKRLRRPAADDDDRQVGGLPRSLPRSQGARVVRGAGGLVGRQHPVPRRGLRDVHRRPVPEERAGEGAALRAREEGRF